MRNLFLLIFIFVAAIKVNGQNHFIGVKGGLSWTTARGNGFKDDFRTKLTMGFTYDYFLKKHFSIGADLLYDQRGFLYPDPPAAGIIGPNYYKMVTTRNYNYISVPLKVGFNYGEKIFGFANVCLVPSFLVKSEIVTTRFNTDGSIRDIGISDRTGTSTQLDFSGLLEVGGGYKFGRYWVYSSISYQHSFYDIIYDSIVLYGFKLNLGLKYALKPE